ncbi:MAG TPA: tyrosine--tRNA ligase, partial [Clostridia bacterium]|nr:tyrosine--tRNA ligase [Clostridia bacterium]
MKNEKVMEILMRNAVNVFSEEGLRKKLESGKPLKVKFGADPSRPDLHLGHTVPLRMLKVLQEAGHQIIFVIGDFTGMIGDPSGKSKTRNSLSFEETRKNGQTYFEQVAKVLDPKKTQIVYNSEWLGKMDFADVLYLAGKYTLARIMERDDFSSRYSNNQPIGIHELLYPLIQGYDSVAINADIEIGGTDQTFNLLVGRELQKDYGQEPQEVITFPLIAGLDGIEKMSKSLDNYIGINEPAETIFEKCMKIPDVLLDDYFRLTTDIP